LWLDCNLNCADAEDSESPIGVVRKKTFKITSPDCEDTVLTEKRSAHVADFATPVARKRACRVSRD
jgi:hypothetical protein